MVATWSFMWSATALLGPGSQAAQLARTPNAWEEATVPARSAKGAATATEEEVRCRHNVVKKR
jgi:hypothetical protein